MINLPPQALADAAKVAASTGAVFPLAPGETVDQLLARLNPMFFDPAFKPSATAKTPPAGQDILTASHNNLYKGVTLADLKGFTERYRLNSRLVKGPAGLVEEPYRVGGRYDAPLRAVVAHLEAARPFATAPMALALDGLIRWYRTGEAPDRRAYDIAWVEDKDSPVDTINGFTEVYLDARGAKGAWEALVFYVNQQKTDAHSAAGQRGAVVRRPHALESGVSQGQRAGHYGQSHRRGDRDRRIGADLAGGDQPAQRRSRAREARQQVRLARERE